MAVGFELPRFYPILDSRVLAQWSSTPVTAAEGVIEGGAKILQFRHKDTWTQRTFDTAKQLAKMCHDAGVLFVLNDRADFAKLLGAALHVGQNDLPPVASRRVIGDEVMGFSTHNQRQLLRANDEPVEYLSIGPIFHTTSKEKPDPVLGLKGLQALRPLTKKPVVAIGGIRDHNARQVLEAGADSVAVISGLMDIDSAYREGVRQATEYWIKFLKTENAAHSTAVQR